MIFPYVSLAHKPLFIKSRQKSQAVVLSGVSLIKIALSNPFPRSAVSKSYLSIILINDTPESTTAWDFCIDLMNNGLLAKPTHGNIIRFAPPLVIDETEMMNALGVLDKTCMEFKKK